MQQKEEYIPEQISIENNKNNINKKFSSKSNLTF